jgi:hypothetical protein
MTSPIANRKTLEDANVLMEAFGSFAGAEAAVRADSSRDLGNAILFCHWRQVERLIDMLSTVHVIGTVH